MRQAPQREENAVLAIDGDDSQPADLFFPSSGWDRTLEAVSNGALAVGTLPCPHRLENVLVRPRLGHQQSQVYLLSAGPLH